MVVTITGLCFGLLLALVQGDISVVEHPLRYLHQDSRIIGGGIAPNNFAPFICSLQIGATTAERQHFCGCSIINPRTLLTAAHCVDYVLESGQLKPSVFARVGTNSYRRGGTLHRLVGHRIHPSFISETLKNDVGLLFPKHPIVFNDRVRPVSLVPEFIQGGVEAIVSGWGTTSVGGTSPVLLKRLDTATLTYDECLEKREGAENETDYDMPQVDDDVELCTFASRGNGVCLYDSGSPLVTRNKRQLIGIVSWAIPCAVGGPDVFVRISTFFHWISMNSA